MSQFVDKCMHSNIQEVTIYAIHIEYMSVCYLCCGEEDFLRNVSDGAGGDTQAHAGEDVGVVSLTGEQRPPVRQRDGVKWAATGKDAPPLQHRQ